MIFVAYCGIHPFKALMPCNNTGLWFHYTALLTKQKGEGFRRGWVEELQSRNTGNLYRR
jgi:hypothetical protein